MIGILGGMGSAIMHSRFFKKLSAYKKENPLNISSFLQIRI